MAALRKLWSTKHRLRILAIILGVGFIYALPLFPAMASIFMQIPGVEGEATQKTHSKWIVVDGFEWGVTNSPDNFSVPTKRDIKLTKPIDKTTPILFNDLVTGGPRETATIEFTKPTSLGEMVYYRLILSDVLVTALTQNATNSSSSIVSESLSLHFQKMEMIYYPIDNSGKATGSPIGTTFDFTKEF